MCSSNRPWSVPVSHVRELQYRGQCCARRSVTSRSAAVTGPVHVRGALLRAERCGAAKWAVTRRSSFVETASRSAYLHRKRPCARWGGVAGYYSP
ncbi:hypothetical protein MHYP_G00153750 [Metynnis hypsauchen]